MKSRNVLEQLVDLAMTKPAKERGQVLQTIATDRTISPCGRRTLVDAVRQAQRSKRRTTS